MVKQILRIELTDQDLQHFSDTILTQSVPASVKRTDPYMSIEYIGSFKKEIKQQRKGE